VDRPLDQKKRFRSTRLAILARFYNDVFLLSSYILMTVIVFGKC